MSRKLDRRLNRVKMPSEQKEPVVASVTRPLRSALLQKQPEIEEVDEEDTSPSSDQSDSTITAGAETAGMTGEISPDIGPLDDLKPPDQKHNHISPKLKQLTRSEALCEECASPPLDPLNLKSTASTCSSDSGIGTKSSITSGSVSGSSHHGVLEKTGSQSSEAGTSSSLSRESSVDTPYKDSTGIDLEDFIRKTLNKTPKDRSMLIKLEVDLIKFIREPKHHYLKFPQMSSYDRMLVHRIAAFFGLDHNVDQTGKCVIVNKTANTRIPDFSFQEAIAKGDDSKPMMLLKRGGNSFDDSMSRNLQKPSMAQMNKAKSLEERQQIYTEVRNRIFTDEDGNEVPSQSQPIGYCQEDAKITGIVKKPDRPQSLGSSTREDNPWSSSESSGYDTDRMGKPTRMIVPKANSFGGTGTFVLQHMKSPMHNSLSKADSMSIGGGYCLQPPFSGGPLRPRLLASPTQCGQSDTSSLSGSARLAPSPQQQQQQPQQQASVSGGPGQHVYWVASDLNSIPAGSVLINPQTGQPFMNPDGTTHKHIPGQPVPQQNYPTQAQQNPVYQLSQDWTTQSQDSVSSQDGVCQQFSMLNLTQQSSIESGGAGDSVSVHQPHAPSQHQMVMNTPVHQQPQFPQQALHSQQGIYYGGPASGGQQSGPVRYLCPVNYGSPVQGQQFTPGAPVLMDGSTGTAHQPYSGQHYCQQYVQPGYPGNSSMYCMSSQEPGMSGQGQAQSCDYQSASGYSVTSPVEGTPSVVTGTGYCYPVSYSQQQTVVAPNQTPMYYTVQTPQSNPTQTAQQGYVQFSGQQGSTYQTNTSPPSQNSAVPTAGVAQLDNGAVTQQPISLNNKSSVNTAPGQQSHPGLVLGSVGNVTPSPGGQYVTSFPASHQQHQMMGHAAHFHQPTAFTSPVRQMAPQVVPMPANMVHGGQSTPMTPGQPFHPVYRPNMQMPMQLYGGAGQPGHQPVMMAAGVQTGASSLHGKPAGQSSHVIVSAKGLGFEADNGTGGESGDIASTCGPDLHRQNHSNTGEIGLPYKPACHGRSQVPSVRAPHVSQTNTRSPRTRKPQRLPGRPSNGDGHSHQPGTSGCGSGATMKGRVLEVCELAPQPVSDLRHTLSPLQDQGASLVCSRGEARTASNLTPLANIEGGTRMNCGGRTLSPGMRVYAVFPEPSIASHILSSHSNNKYRLRAVHTIQDS